MRIETTYRRIIESLTRAKPGELSTFDLVILLHEQEWARGNKDPALSNLRAVLSDFRKLSLKGLSKGKVTRWEKDQMIGFCAVRIAIAHESKEPEILSDQYLVDQLYQAGFRKVSQQNFNATYKPTLRKLLKERWNIDY